MRVGRRLRWAGAVGAVAGAALMVGLSVASATASSGPPPSSATPYQIRSASLHQSGQQLVWSVELAQPWSASRLAGEHRSICLLIERVGSGDVWAEACLTGPGRGSPVPHLEYLTVTGGRAVLAHSSSATVTRASAEALTATFLPAAVDLRYGTIRWQTISTLSSAACAREIRSGASAGAGCAVAYPSRPMLLRLHTPVLVGCVAKGSSLVYQGSSSGREIALTFDDGPWNDPPSIDFVRMLEREHVPATFFEIGDQIATYDPGGAVERQMLAGGDMIGDHSWSHPNVAALRPSRQRAQLLDTAAAIKRVTGGFTPCLWRPPYGAISRSLVSLARSLGFITIMWDVDPRDWALPGVGAISSNVIDHAHNGAIVIQHFGGGPRSETLSAVPQEINALRAHGYRFVTVAQMLGLQLVYR